MSLSIPTHRHIVSKIRSWSYQSFQKTHRRRVIESFYSWSALCHWRRCIDNFPSRIFRLLTDKICHILHLICPFLSDRSLGQKKLAVRLIQTRMTLQYEPLAMKIPSSRLQVMLGVGTPLARHSISTGSPSRTLYWLGVALSSMFGGSSTVK